MKLMQAIDTCLYKQSLTGWDDECGDTGVIKTYDNECFCALVDVLGHGREAHDISILAEQYLLENYRHDLVDVMNGLHSHLTGTRGAVVALCRLNLTRGVLHYVGVGNITTRIYGSEYTSFIPKGGIVGYSMTAPKEHQVTIYPGDILILYSDGLRQHFDLAQYPVLLNGTAQEVAANLIDNLGKGDDDVSCIVLRYKK